MSVTNVKNFVIRPVVLLTDNVGHDGGSKQKRTKSDPTKYDAINNDCPLS